MDTTVHGMGNVVILIRNMHVATGGVARGGKGSLARREMGTKRMSQNG